MDCAPSVPLRILIEVRTSIRHAHPPDEAEGAAKGHLAVR
jgi:hypothetical protein